MSDVVEKTLAAIPKLFGDDLLSGQSHGPSNQKSVPGLGPTFQNFLRLFHKCKTKSEEVQFTKAQINDVKEQLNMPSLSKEKETDLLFVCVYCHMLGHDVEFAKINALKMAACSSDVYMKIGFTVSNLLMDMNDDLALLLTSTMVKNLNSNNILDVCNTMASLAHFATPSSVQIVLSYLQAVQTHSKSLIRTKSVMCLHQYYLQLPELLQYECDSFYKSLCDKDPSVMAAACQIFYQFIKKDNTKYTSLVPVLVNLLQQIIDQKLPKEYEYHSIPSPWLQIRILKMLALLGKGNQRLSSLIYPVIHSVLERTGLREKMAFAICYECIVTCTSIYPNQELLQIAANTVGNFLRSKDLSLKYIGIKALICLVHVSQEFALQYQMIVVELLDDADETIKRKTLLLLYSMTNSVNIQPVCEKLIHHMTHSTDPYYKQDLLSKTTELLKIFFKPEPWYADTLFKLLTSGCSGSDSSIVNQLMSTLKSGMQKRPEFCQCLVKKSVEYLYLENSSADIVQLASWILGQSSSLLRNMPKDKIMTLFTKHLSRQSNDVMTKFLVLTAMGNLVCSDVLTSDVISGPVEELVQGEGNQIIKEKLRELLRISKISSLTKKNLYLHKEKKDFTLSFLDGYVADSLQKGGKPYRPRHMRTRQRQQEQGVTELFKGIQEQDNLSASNVEDIESSGTTSLTKSDPVSTLPVVKRVWGREGRIDPDRSRSMSEEDQNTDDSKQEMINALFGGISRGQVKNKEEREPDPFFTEEENFDIKNINSLTSDSGGWRQLHQSTKHQEDHVKSEESFEAKHEDLEELDKSIESLEITDNLNPSYQNIFSNNSDNRNEIKHSEDDELAVTGGTSLYDEFLGEDQSSENKQDIYHSSGYVFTDDHDDP